MLVFAKPSLLWDLGEEMCPQIKPAGCWGLGGLSIASSVLLGVVPAWPSRACPWTHMSCLSHRHILLPYLPQSHTALIGVFRCWWPCFTSTSVYCHLQLRQLGTNITQDEDFLVALVLAVKEHAFCILFISVSASLNSSESFHSWTSHTSDSASPARPCSTSPPLWGCLCVTGMLIWNSPCSSSS